jgi:hypothetical protein
MAFRVHWCDDRVQDYSDRHVWEVMANGILIIKERPVYPCQSCTLPIFTPSAMRVNNGITAHPCQSCTLPTLESTTVAVYKHWYCVQNLERPKLGDGGSTACAQQPTEIRAGGGTAC